MSNLIVVNTDYVPGREITEALGLVRGLSSHTGSARRVRLSKLRVSSVAMWRCSPGGKGVLPWRPRPRGGGLTSACRPAAANRTS